MVLFGCNLLFRFFLFSSVVLGLGLGCMHASLVYLGCTCSELLRMHSSSALSLENSVPKLYYVLSDQPQKTKVDREEQHRHDTD
jgi:hypothetical protein